MHFTGHFYYLRKALAEYEMCRKIYDFITYGFIFFHSLFCILYLRIGPKIFSSSSLAHIILAYFSWPTKVHAHLISFKLKLRIFQSKNDGEKNTASI